jgi:hypothetical protein
MGFYPVAVVIHVLWKWEGELWVRYRITVHKRITSAVRRVAFVSGTLAAGNPLWLYTPFGP